VIYLGRVTATTTERAPTPRSNQHRELRSGMTYTYAFKAGAPRSIPAALGPIFLEALDVMSTYASQTRPLTNGANGTILMV